MLWERAECESPLRLALLVQDICRKIRVRESKRVRELHETEDYFCLLATKLLDNIQDQVACLPQPLDISAPQ